MTDHVHYTHVSTRHRTHYVQRAAKSKQICLRYAAELSFLEERELYSAVHLQIRKRIIQQKPVCVNKYAKIDSKICCSVCVDKCQNKCVC